MKCSIGSGLAAVALVAACCCSITLAKEKENNSTIDKKDVPKAVIVAFEKAYPKAVIRKFQKIEKNGQTLYKIKATTGQTKFGNSYTADGTVVRSYEMMEATGLPDAVKKAVTEAYPKGKVGKAKKVTQGTTVEYDVSVLTGKEKSNLKLDAAGNIISAPKGETENEKE
jgi:hypothetical protein